MTRPSQQCGNAPDWQREVSMIRPVVTGDLDAVIDLAVYSTLFAADDRPFLRQLVAGYVGVENSAGPRMRLSEEEATARGVVYYQPKPAADGVWDLSMIAVARPQQGRGVGTELMRHVETELRGEGVRLLLVETSSTPTFTATRAFYARLGYREAARVPDYWSDGDDLVLFVKDLRRDAGRH
jgi:ribosomal protein S18 acetylase RimI-like enzyme